MLNNALGHAEAQTIPDDGVGLFREIQAALGLLDERHAVLELAKGKFTADPQRHSGSRVLP